MPRVPRPTSPFSTAAGERGGLRWQTAPEGGAGRGWAGRGLPTQGADRLCPTQWEKSQLDEEFMHSEENVCGCAKYECGERGGRARVSEPWVGWVLGSR